MASLSSRDSHVRQAGYHVISRFMTHLEGTRFKERKQVNFRPVFVSLLLPQSEEKQGDAS